eukprot:Platyproteum_vivax@DN7215_c1_g1_i7.p1
MVVKKFVCLVVFLIWGSEMVAGIQRRHASEPSEGAAAPVPITVEMMGPVTDDDGTYTKPVEQHSGRKKGDKEFPCSICGAVLQYSQSLTRHMKAHRNPPEKKARKHTPKGNSEAKMAKNKFECPECKKRYKTKQILNNHRQEKHQGEIELLKCPQCPKTFPTTRRQHLKRHIRQVHQTVGHEFVCEACARRFKSKDSLIKHQGEKHPGEPQTHDEVEDMETTGSETRAPSGSKIEVPSASAIQVVCPHCNKLLSGRLNRHIATQHSDIQAVPVV